MPYTEEELEGLTDAEREGVLATDEDEDEEEGNDSESNGAADEEEDADAGDAGADDGADAGAGDEAEPADSDAAPDAEPDPAPAAAEPQKPTPPAQVAAPLLVIQAPVDADEKLAAIATRKEEIAQQFDDGEITAKEFQKALDAENRAEREIERQVHSAELAQQMEDQRVQRQWIADCDAFLSDHPEYGDKNSKAFQILNESILTIARMPSNAGLSNEKALAKAHRIVVAELGEPPANTSAVPAAPTKQAKIPRAPAPPNIGNLPQAAIAGTASGEFKHLERLQSTNPDAYEEAVAKLSPAQNRRWLES